VFGADPGEFELIADRRQCNETQGPARIQLGPLTPAEIPRSLEFDWKGKRFSFEYPLITAVRQRGYVFSNGHSRFGLFLTI